jgi:uncharacterized protein (TIGR02118 family)
MIKVSVLYENTPGKKFDMAYYCAKHIPMVRQKLGAACKRTEVDQGLGGVQPGSKPAFIAQAHFLFDSIESFQQAFAPHAESIMADIPNYTDLAPIIQLNEVKL